jgi:hypothetical protein
MTEYQAGHPIHSGLSTHDRRGLSPSKRRRHTSALNDGRRVGATASRHSSLASSPSRVCREYAGAAPPVVTITELA